MKKNVLLLVVFILFSSCSDEPSALSIRWEPQREGVDSLWCAGDNIKWYNGTTGELKFKTEPSMEPGAQLALYLNDEKLISFVLADPYSSVSYIRPCIVVEPDGFYIRKSYFIYWEPDKMDEYKESAEENWKAIEPEWNIFIRQLKKEGRYRK